MPSAYYTVIPDGAAWQINLDGKNYGPYDSKAIAITNAIGTANDAGKRGYAAHVMVQDAPGGAYRLHWTYGKDPLPGG